MKVPLFIGCVLLAFTSSFAQTTEIIRIKGGELPYFIAKEGYRYPTFMQSRVYFKDGDSAGGRLNYNYLLQSMQFMDPKGDTLVISNEKNISYISIGMDTFFYDNGYYEWIASSATAKLAVKHSLKTAGTQKLGAFGIPSATNKIESQDEIRSYNTQKLDINEEIVFAKQKAYYVSGLKNHFVEANKKNMSKLFPEKDIDNYIKENKLNLNKEGDLVDLFVFLCTHR